MGVVIALSDARTGKVRDRLLTFAIECRPAIVETRTSLIAAEKILCRESVVEMFNAAGDYFAVRYSDILGVMPAAAKQTGVVNASGDWSPLLERKSRIGSGMLLAFPKRRRG